MQRQAVQIDIVTRIIITVMAEGCQEPMQRQAVRIEIVAHIIVAIMGEGCAEPQ